MDIKHVLSCNPAPARLRRRCACRRRRDRRPADLDRARRRACRDRPRRRRVRLRQRVPPPPGRTSSPSPSPTAPVTCGEWLAFIDDGGYHRPELWLSDGWATVQAEGWEAPLYWSQDRRPVARVHPGRPRRRRPRPSRSATSATTRPTPSPAGPGAACRPRPSGRWRRPGDRVGRATSSTRPSSIPTPVGRGPAPASSATSGSGPRRAYSPYPGFEPAPGAVGEYNGKFMVNQYVLRGGSCVTPPGPRPGHLPQLLPAVGPLGLHRPAAGPGRLTGGAVIPHDRPRRMDREPMTTVIPPTIDVHLTGDDLRGALEHDVRTGLTAEPK